MFVLGMDHPKNRGTTKVECATLLPTAHTGRGAPTRRRDQKAIVLVFRYHA